MATVVALAAGAVGEISVKVIWAAGFAEASPDVLATEAAR